jgi:spore coat protein JB
MANQNDRFKLFQWINMVSFAVNDITLYLDTHPCDEKAMRYFNHYCDLRMQALQEYECCYGPLTLDTTTAEGKWLWSTQPMPWEGGMC